MSSRKIEQRPTPEIPSEGETKADRESSQAMTTAPDVARDYANASRSYATWRAYRHDWQRIVTWCAAVDQPALPASATTVAAFLATEANAGLATSTLTRRLAAIRDAHLTHQQPSTHDAPAVREVMRGIRHRQKARAVVRKAPLLDTDLALLVDTLDLDTLAGVRDRALLLLGFAAALRRNVAKLVKQCVKDAGHQEVSIFAGHSLRLGFITTAARNRVSRQKRISLDSDAGVIVATPMGGGTPGSEHSVRQAAYISRV